MNESNKVLHLRTGGVYTGELYPPVELKMSALLYYSTLSEENKRAVEQFLEYNGWGLVAEELKVKGTWA